MASPEGWSVSPGTSVQLGDIDPSSTPGAPGEKSETKSASKKLRKELIALQSRLWAEDRQALLLVLQAMDAGGKDGAIRKVFSGVNPQGCRVTSFKEPTDEELQHDFLWRISKALPRHGEIGIFNRSHYEDVVVVRVHNLVPEAVWRGRYDTINAFERGLVGADTKVVKVFLHVSKDEQAIRLQKRLANPDKRWKFRSSDLKERDLWDDYQLAYQAAITETSTDHAPWFVIPADHKWYRDFALLTILTDTLRSMDPQFPKAEKGLEDIKIT